MIKPLLVIDVDSDEAKTKTITLKYGGMPTGTYRILLSSISLGKLDTSTITFTSIGKITGFDPIEGSIYGGTVITITGINFSDRSTDNPVQVGYTPCDVFSTSNTVIKCRTQSKKPSDPDVVDMIVFLRTFEEA